ncbi:MAG: hypothetical protein ACOY9J_03435 [Pseudomonadota bacterium]
MALHRAEQIVEAVIANITGLTTTGDNVFRSRTAELPDNRTPALVVYLGPDAPRSDGGSSSYRYIDGDLTVFVVAAVKGRTDALTETKLNLIRKEVTIALMADHTQGLSFVIDTTEGQAVPEINGDGDKPVGRLRMEFTFHYRRSRTDPSA